MTAVVIGYAPVSTEDQNLNLQRGALGRAGCQRIYEHPARTRELTEQMLVAGLPV